MSAEVILPSPTVSLLDSGTLATMDPMALPVVCGPHRGTRRPSGGTAESESDSPPPSKKSKKSRRRRKRPRNPCGRSGLRTKPVAPFNTTQFLMEEHDLLQDTDIVARPRRHRDSSFSMDSDDQSNQFYSSPEDEEEFLTKEFWMAYEDVHAERLDTMTKAQLVQEYLALEEKVDMLERQLRAVRARHRYRFQHHEEEEDDAVGPGEVRVDSETAQKITIFQSEINNLEVENRRLREENFALRRFSGTRSSSSSSSSSSSGSSSSSSSSSSSDSSSDSEQEGGQKEGTVIHQSSAAPVTECQPDSGVSCDSAEAADPPSSSSATVVSQQQPQIQPSEVEEVTGSKCVEVGGVEGEVSSTTMA